MNGRRTRQGWRFESLPELRMSRIVVVLVLGSAWLVVGVERWGFGDLVFKEELGVDGEAACAGDWLRHVVLAFEAVEEEMGRG